MMAARRLASEEPAEDAVAVLARELHALAGDRDALEGGLAVVARHLRAERLHFRARGEDGFILGEVIRGGPALLAEDAVVAAEDGELVQVFIHADAGTIRFMLTHAFALELGRGTALLAFARAREQFTSVERATLRALLPHLVVAWRASRLQSR